MHLTETDWDRRKMCPLPKLLKRDSEGNLYAVHDPSYIQAKKACWVKSKVRTTSPPIFWPVILL
jgi:hypothetical protein